MKKLVYSLLFILIIDLLNTQCANPIAPTGGSKDTIPPTLLESTPKNQSLRFKEKTITLVFDERITADKLKQSLIITPNIETKFKTFIKKNIAYITFETDFEDSTTYTLNFFDGITDITEKNSAENLILAFSTGDYIDSLFLYGNIKNIYTDKPTTKTIVGLYRLTDTLDYQKIKPTYFTTTNDKGEFSINNVKADNYKFFAFQDENKNLLFDPGKEEHIIYKDTIKLQTSIEDSILIKSIKIDASKLGKTSARPNGKYFDIKYSKPINKFKIENKDSLYIPAALVEENSTIRIYNNQQIKDSLQIIITAIDTLKQIKKDTTYLKFRESARKSAEYTYSLNPKKGQSVFTDQLFTIQFNKPTEHIQQISLEIPLDTINSIYITPDKLKYNDTKTSLSFRIPITKKQLEDSIKSTLTKYKIDSTNIDSIALYVHKNASKLNTNTFSVIIPSKTFTSVEFDTAAAITSQYSFADPSQYGLIKLKLETNEPSYFVQLMSGSEVYYQTYNCSTCNISNVKPGNYWIRILIDKDQNKVWDYGNYQTNTPPEPVLFFKEETTLRANWEVELEYKF